MLHSLMQPCETVRQSMVCGIPFETTVVIKIEAFMNKTRKHFLLSGTKINLSVSGAQNLFIQCLNFHRQT